jgi:hypothetical protein
MQSEFERKCELDGAIEERDEARALIAELMEEIERHDSRYYDFKKSPIHIKAQTALALWRASIRSADGLKCLGNLKKAEQLIRLGVSLEPCDIVDHGWYDEARAFLVQLDK